MEAEDQSAARSTPPPVDSYRCPRFKIEVDITIRTRTCGVLTGYTVDISESGIGTMLKMEVPLMELVALEFTLPLGRVAIYATARQRSAFRYGFQYLALHPTHPAIAAICRDLAADR